jgi:hypothetical protein
MAVMPELFLVSITMFFVWRLWLHLHGVKWKPEGRWESRTAASQQYLDSLPPLTRPQKVEQIVVFVISLTIVTGLIALLIVLAKSRH